MSSKKNRRIMESDLRSNHNLHTPKDVHVHAGVVYGDARQSDARAQEHAEEVFDELERKADGITPKNPDDGGPKMRKTIYTNKISLDESLFESVSDENPSEIAKFLKDSVEWLVDEDMGCTCYKLDDRLGICVGWQDGYDADDSTVIHSASEPTYAIVAGIKVYTSDDMRTDYDWINYPYFANGDVYDASVSIGPNENYDELAKFFIKEFDAMEDWEIEEDGLVIRSNDGEEDAVEESLDFEPMVSPDEWAAYKGVSVIGDDEIVGLDIKNARDKLGRWYRLDSQSVGSYRSVYNFTRPGFGQFSKVTLVTDKNGVVNEVKGVVFSDEKSEESLSPNPNRKVRESKKLTEKKGKVEGEDDNVFQLVYDALFIGNKNYRPQISQVGLPYDWEHSLIGGGLSTYDFGDYDIGVTLSTEDEGARAKDVAEKLKLKYEVRPTNAFRDGTKFIGIIRIPDATATQDATEYVTSIGLSMDDIRPKKKKK